MGGAKKPTAAKKDKPENAKDSKKGKKDKGEGGPRKAEIVVMVNEQQAMKIIQNSKVLTVQDLARQTGVKISAAIAFLPSSGSICFFINDVASGKTMTPIGKLSNNVDALNDVKSGDVFCIYEETT